MEAGLIQHNEAHGTVSFANMCREEALKPQFLFTGGAFPAARDSRRIIEAPPSPRSEDGFINDGLVKETMVSAQLPIRPECRFPVEAGVSTWEHAG